MCFHIAFFITLTLTLPKQGVHCTQHRLNGINAMTHAIEFIETSIFTRQIKQIATDDELRSLQVELIANPLKGELIKETGGLRKVRMATGHKGKSGSTRVIYFVAHLERIYFVLAYHKTTKTTLSKSEKAQLKELVIKLKGE